jgi:hypothetical protein
MATARFDASMTISSLISHPRLSIQTPAPQADHITNFLDLLHHHIKLAQVLHPQLRLLCEARHEN